jgi:hypothetical protein
VRYEVCGKKYRQSRRITAIGLSHLKTLYLGFPVYGKANAEEIGNVIEYRTLEKWYHGFGLLLQEVPRKGEYEAVFDFP